MSSSTLTDGYAKVCGLIDEFAASSITPVGWRRTVYPAIEELRSASAPAEQVSMAERLSVTLLKLDWAILKGDNEKQERARQKLNELSETLHGKPTLASSQQTETLTEGLERINRRSLSGQ